MKKYTVGFIFSKDLKKVLLVHKTAPEWQIGYINGVGGKLEEGETGIECIVREIKEETNIDATSKNVQYIGVLTVDDKNAEVEVYGFIYSGTLFKPYIFEKEKLEWFSVDRLPKNVIPNLRWLIPLAKEKLEAGKLIRVTAEYTAF